MTTPFTNAVKKEDTKADSTPAQAADSRENVEAKLDEAQENGKHGKDFCCGSCS